MLLPVEVVAVVGGALVHVLQEGGRPQYGAVAAAVAPVLRVTATELQCRLGRQTNPLSVQPVEPERAAERTKRPQELAAAWRHEGVLLHTRPYLREERSLAAFLGRAPPRGGG